MRRHGWQGVRRQRSVRTTISDPAAERAPDLVDRQFRVSTPNALVVADFTYVKLVTGVFVYVAFVIDAYAGAIIGWEAASVKATRFVESAIRQASALRARQGHRIDGAIHHSDAGSQSAIHFRDALAAVPRSAAGDAYDRRPSGSIRTNASVPIHRSAAAQPRRHRRLRQLGLMHRLGRIPPAEALHKWTANRPAHRTPRVHETRDGPKYDPETRAKAVRLVLEHREVYPSEWAAITAVSKRLGRRCATGSANNRSTTGSATGCREAISMPARTSFFGGRATRTSGSSPRTRSASGSLRIMGQTCTYAASRRPRSGACGTPPSPRFWPASMNPTPTVAARRSRCTGR